MQAMLREQGIVSTGFWSGRMRQGRAMYPLGARAAGRAGSANTHTKAKLSSSALSSPEPRQRIRKNKHWIAPLIPPRTHLPLPPTPPAIPIILHRRIEHLEFLLPLLLLGIREHLPLNPLLPLQLQSQFYPPSSAIARANVREGEERTLARLTEVHEVAETAAVALALVVLATAGLAKIGDGGEFSGEGSTCARSSARVSGREEGKGHTGVPTVVEGFDGCGGLFFPFVARVDVPVGVG